MVRKAADPEFAANYAIAERWKQTSLREGRSLFDASRTVWTEATVADLHTRFVDSLDESDRSFGEKLEDQFRGADQNSCLLMAELMLIHLLPVKSVGLAAKLRNIDQIGTFAPDPFATPESFHAGLVVGLFSGGAGFNTRRWHLVSFLIKFAGRWIAADQAERDLALEDPWAFKAFLQSLPYDGVVVQLNALLMLLFPESFEDISSRDHKKRIVDAFPESIGESSDIDRQILAIRSVKEQDFGTDFSWYASEVRPTWDKQAQIATRSTAPDSAGEFLNAVFADDEDRSAFASVFAEAVLIAHEVNPSSWSVSFRNGGVHLNISANRTLSATPDELGAAVYFSSTQELEQAVERLGITADERPFAFPGDDVHTVESRSIESDPRSPEAASF